MDLGTLQYAKGSRKNRKRVGRGIGSGHGGTSCRGHKGQRSRSGSKIRPWFEGGQMPLQRRIPKRGFTNIFRKEFQIVNLAAIDKHVSKGQVTPETLHQLGLIDKKGAPIKILGHGELSNALEITAHAFSKSATEKIEKAGGKVVRI